jgi:glycopeptide antibiotics resistance protein
MASSKVQSQRLFQYRIALIVGIIIILPLGYWVRFHSPAPEWLNDLLGSVAYQIFLMMLVAFFLPKASLVWVALWVCLASCAIEFLQLWQPPFLQAIRATLLGRLILGNTFSWSDFPAYFIGSFVGWVGMRSLIHITQLQSSPTKRS